jgi:hypothetical protein
MTDHATSTDHRPAPSKGRWPGILSLIAAYLFGLAALLIVMLAPGRLSASLVQALPLLALGLVFLVIGLKNIGLKEIAQAGHINPYWPIAIVVMGIVPPLSFLWILPPRWHPDLKVKNTGTTAVMLDFKGLVAVIQPSETWRNRFYAGDTLTIRASESVDAPSLTVTLPERNPKPWTLNSIAQRYTAEVNADDPANIRFENRRFEEIPSPPSPSEPWP